MRIEWTDRWTNQKHNVIQIVKSKQSKSKTLGSGLNFIEKNINHLIEEIIVRLSNTILSCSPTDILALQEVFKIKKKDYWNIVYDSHQFITFF